MKDGDRGERRRSRVLVYAHFVWAVKWRADRLTPEFERRIYRKIVSEAEAMKCWVLALDGMPDHVHLVARLSGSVSAAGLMKQVKGSSSALFNTLRPEYSEPFDWQDGYACFSIGQDPDELARVVAYVRNQKQHHAADTTISEWEETSLLVSDAG